MIFASTLIVFGPNYCEDVRAVKDALQMKKENHTSRNFPAQQYVAFSWETRPFFVFAALLSSDPDTAGIRPLRLVSTMCAEAGQHGGPFIPVYVLRE